MKRKISLFIAGLGLCASTVVFYPYESDADPCVVKSIEGSGWASGACYGSGGNCTVDICLGTVVVNKREMKKYIPKKSIDLSGKVIYR